MPLIPGPLAHVAKFITTYAFDETATHLALDRHPAEGAKFGIFGYPYDIGLFISLMIHPLLDQPQCLILLVAAERIVVVALALKTEDLAAVTFYFVMRLVDLDTVVAVCLRADLVMLIVCG